MHTQTHAYTRTHTHTHTRLPRPLMKLMTLALLHLAGTSIVQTHKQIGETDSTALLIRAAGSNERISRKSREDQVPFPWGGERCVLSHRRCSTALRKSPKTNLWSRVSPPSVIPVESTQLQKHRPCGVSGESWPAYKRTTHSTLLVLSSLKVRWPSTESSDSGSPS